MYMHAYTHTYFNFLMFILYILSMCILYIRYTFLHQNSVEAGLFDPVLYGADTTGAGDSRTDPTCWTVITNLWKL